MLTDLGAVGRWMQERDLHLDQLTSAAIVLDRGVRKVLSVRNFEQLLRYLRVEA
jgi:hypothetical protein